jgi:signal transduction histidine kinase
MKAFPYRQLLLFSFFIFTGCHPSTLKNQQPNTKPDERITLDSLKRLDSLVTVYKESDLVASIHLARHALALASVKRFPAAVVKAYSILGSVYFNKKMDSSFFFFSEALKLADKYNIILQKPSLYCNLSKIYTSASDFKTSLVLLDSAKRFAILNQNFAVLSDVYNELGNIKLDVSDSSDAAGMFDSAYSVARNHSLYFQMGVALGSLSGFEKNIRKSINIDRQALVYLNKYTGTGKPKALILINIGFKQQNQDSAISYYIQALQALGNGNSDEVAIAALNNLACSYIDKKEYDNAEHCLRYKAIPIAEKDNNYDWLSTLYDTYTSLWMAGGKFRNAALSGMKALDFMSRAYNKRAADQVRLLAAVMNVKDKEIRLRNNDVEIQIQQNKIQKMNLFIVILLLMFGFLIFITLWIVQRVKLKTQKQAVASAKRIIDIEENLKNRLSMELHDMTSPIYTNLLLQIETTDIPDSKIKNEISAKLSELAEKIRQISHKMNKVFIGQLTFREQVVGICEDMQYMTEAKISLDIFETEVSLSSEKATHIIRIIQELLSNAVKYVKGGEIDLNVYLERKNINIIYRDNGPGFEPGNTNLSGLGLINISERAKLMGGKAVLDSAPSKGTHWFIYIPV